MRPVYAPTRDRGPDAAVGPVLPTRGAGASVSRNVLLLGLTSLFTDVSSEMVTAVLPLYFMLELRMTPLQFGLIDGLYQGSSALVRVASGLWADAGHRYKQVATIGYGLSAICKLGLLLASAAWLQVTALLMLDRLGKGIRTAPRDALITLSSDRAHLGTAFGVHRAMDTVGAVLGPVIAFAVLASAPGRYDAVFVISLAVGLIGLATIGLFVENVRARLPAARPSTTLSRARLAAAFANPRFTAIVIAGGLLGLLTASDALIFLMLQRHGAVPPTFFPLLFVGTSCAYLVLAVPMGWLADRVGSHRLFLAGHLCIVAIYALLQQAELSTIGIITSVALLGTYYAATDGVLAALSSSVLGDEQITTGLSIVSTATALARLASASLFGALWSWLGPAPALVTYLAGLLVALLIASMLLQVTIPWTRGKD